MTHAHSEDVCPRCSSEDIEQIRADVLDEGDALTADVTPPVADPPNMRCNACGHTWWAPDASNA